jgi:hypothetical protein
MKWNSINISALILSGLVGTAWTIFLFIESLELRTPGIRSLAQMAIVFVILSILIYWLLQRLGPALWGLHIRQRVELLIFSSIFAGLLVVMIPIAQDKFIYAFLPAHELTVSAENGSLDQVKILQFNTATGAVDPAEILRTSTKELSWRGKPGDQAALAFKPLNQSLLVKVDWDGNSQSLDLSASTKRDVIFVKQFFSISWAQRFLWFVSVWLALASVLFAGALLLVSAPWKPAKWQSHWLWYATPMIATWMVYLLTFWPGLMSPDSIMQWGEVQSGQFSDAHPAIHTMFIWLLSRLWNTPAVLVIFHIILLSLLTAWGLGELQKQHISPIVLWTGAVIFALFPINGLMIISVWKDITYACALFALFLQFVKIVFSNGKWLESNWNLAGLLLAGLTTAFVRHNGLPVVLACLVVLLLVYRNFFRRLLVSMLIFMIFWVGIQGPLYNALDVKQYPGFGNILFLDHINAHIHAGTALKPAETAFIETLLPLSAWPYNCADSDIRKMDGPIPFDYFTQATGEPARIAISLFMRDPMVDIQHTLCADSLVWKINTGQYLSVVSMGQARDGTYTWISPNTLGLVEHSFLPGLMPILSNLFSDKDLLAKPALYLLVAIFALAIVSMRRPSKKLILVFLPLIFQTGVMLLVNFAQDFRYLYSTVLIALFSLVMLFIPREIDVQSGLADDQPEQNTSS